MKRKVIILGSTGSIGRSTLEVIANLPGEFDVVGLAAGTRWSELAAQARFWKPQFAAIAAHDCQKEFQAALPAGCTALCGPDSVIQLVERADCDCVVAGMVGVAGLPATMKAVELGRKVAIANKETLVVAGAQIMNLARRCGASILPIDSEHSAVFQAMQAGHPEDVERIFLTASGGPFRTWTSERMAGACVEEALQHPTWDMGPKITIDSANMMNKALEIIEARWLFGLRHDQIEVVIHPESVIHSLVEFRDGSMVAQLGTPDMRTPIQYALTFPRRQPCPSQRLSLAELGKLTFDPPDEERFPALRLGRAVAQRGGSAGAVLNAANERANELYREGRIGFSDIVSLTEDVLSRHEWIEEPDIEQLLAADAWARTEVARALA